jgi:hypothetical protein
MLNVFMKEAQLVSSCAVNGLIPSLWSKSRHSEIHPPAVIRAVVARSRKRNGGLWENQTFNAVIVNSRVWVGSRQSI